MTFLNGDLRDHPYRVGTELSQPPFEGDFSARRGTYRIGHRIDEERKIVRVARISHRRDAYRT